jgi:hypothetical protein
MNEETTEIRYIPTRALALAKALELRRILEALATHPDEGPGSTAEYAMQGMDDVIGYLTPDEDDADEA